MPHHASARRSSRRPGPAAGARFARYGGLWPSAVLASSSSSAATMSTRPTTSAPPRSAQADPTADVETGTPTTGESVRPRTYLLDVDESTTVLRAAPPRSSARRVATEGVKRGWLDARPSSPEGRAEREGQHSRSRPSDAPTGLKGGRSPTPDQLRGLPRSSELSRRLPTGKPAVTAHVAPRVRLAVASQSRVVQHQGLFRVPGAQDRASYETSRPCVAPMLSVPISVSGAGEPTPSTNAAAARLTGVHPGGSRGALIVKPG